MYEISLSLSAPERDREAHAAAELQYVAGFREVVGKSRFSRFRQARCGRGRPNVPQLVEHTLRSYQCCNSNVTVRKCGPVLVSLSQAVF